MTVVRTAIPPFTIEPRRQIYLGMDPRDRYRRCWASPDESVGLIGPPGFGKSSGIVIPTLMTWDGPVVATSCHDDLIRFTRHWRARLAARNGGRVYIYDPFGMMPEEQTVRWSLLAGCEDRATCWRRAAEVIKPIIKAVGNEGELLRAGAAVLLRGLFHAAALSGGDLDDVWRWFGTRDFEPVKTILRGAGPEASSWADALEVFREPVDIERRILFAAQSVLDVTAEPRVRASTRAPDLDIDEMLRSGSTLFIVMRTRTGAVGPLVLALLDAIKQRAGALTRGRTSNRLDPPLLIAMDDMPEVAPNPTLSSQLSEGGKSGILTLWTAQSMAQLRGRFGEETTGTLLANTTVKLIFGGGSNGGDLNDVSAWAGLLNRREKLLPPEAVQMLPPFYAWLFYHSGEPLLVETRAASLLAPYRQLTSAPNTEAP
jgi:type IV secretion system protein VirD4